MNENIYVDTNAIMVHLVINGVLFAHDSYVASTGFGALPPSEAPLPELDPGYPDI